MIKDPKLWRKWERELIANTPVDVERNFAIFEALCEHARELGVFRRADPLEGIEVKIRLAKALNVQTSPPADRR